MKASTRKRILDLIISTDAAFDFANNRDDGIVPFLNEIWDLKSMPSEDSRYNDAEGDVIQHTINNDDWDLHELFEQRLKLVENENYFIKFVEVFLLPKYQSTLELTSYFTEKINDILKKEGLILATVSYEGDFPIIELTKMDTLDRPSDIPINKIPFYVIPYPSMNISNYANQLKVDNEKPKTYFLLIADNWDDQYKYETTFGLVCFDDGNKVILGSLKIASNNNNYTMRVLPSEFYSLGEEFVSLGQDEDYYNNLHEMFGKNIGSILYSLKDAAFFTEISEEFENLDVFKSSLTRDDEAERIHRIAKPMVSGADLNKLYAFTYKFHPKYSDFSIDVPFHFSTDGALPKRMIALIGKNGAGKTQLLTSLPIEIAKENSELLIPQKPIYSKIIAVSYSTFDNFELPKKTSNFNYVYCGLRDEKGVLRTKLGQLQKFHNTWKKIHKLGRLEKWKKVISNFLDAELIELFIKPDPEDSIKLYFDKHGFDKARELLSSGQSIVLFVVSEIVANIRLDSLLLFDEPETHLHPNAISQLMNGIAELINEFESYCIIATHSPIIIQEMFSRDVLVISREENVPSVNKIGVESFGENLSVITEEVFGNRSIPKYYETTMKKLVEDYGSYDKVLKVLQKDKLPVSLNVRLYLQNLVENNAQN
ncbi:AAA family ATPase [Colwellia sp. 6_MG-2023]|uniref:AbiJ-related protein n=1 Tax=Colwellia sp. 6_MG-2023 TaxID=3062676 RepID=UPI0026E228A0|nr:AAA family ATPase [Colwellia sp. 6_MG-2023]MDO6488425.1 AAA family ATPase [Colwellia sp. 6_MG-2023]